MPVDAYAEYIVKVLDDSYYNDIEKWAIRHGGCKFGIGRHAFTFANESPGWVEDFIDGLRVELLEMGGMFGVPTSAWSLHARYELTGGPNVDGNVREFDVVDGRMTNCAESVMQMVAVDSGKWGAWADMNDSEVSFEDLLHYAGNVYVSRAVAYMDDESDTEAACERLESMRIGKSDAIRYVDSIEREAIEEDLELFGERGFAGIRFMVEERRWEMEDDVLVDVVYDRDIEA